MRLKLGQWDLPVVMREDLIAMKLAAGGGIDFEDARQLLSIHAGRLDETLLAQSCKRLKVDDKLTMIRPKK